MSALTISMNESRDLFMNRFGSVESTADEDAMAEYMTQLLSSLQGEFRFNKQRGMVYMTTIYTTGDAGIPPLRASIINAVNNADVSVLGVASLDLAHIDERLRMQMTIATTYGNIYLQV